jgi:hypothetical protein
VVVAEPPLQLVVLAIHHPQAHHKAIMEEMAQALLLIMVLVGVAVRRL